MSEKRFYISFITASRQIKIVDRETTFVAVIDVYDDKIQYFVDKLNEQQATIRKLQDLCGESDGENAKLRIENKRLQEENMQLKDYIGTIFEDNTHICKYLDVEDVQFYCDKNKNYRNPSCLYEKCFDEENLIKIKDEIRRVLE